MKGFLKFLVVVIVIVGAGLGGAYFLISSPAQEIDVTWTEDDFSSYLAKLDKGGVTLDGSQASVEDIFANNVAATGKTYVDTTITSAELTAIANKSWNGNSVFRNVKIKCVGDDELQMSAVIGDISPLIDQFPVLEKYESIIKLVENKEVYMNATLFYNEATGLFDGSTKEIYVGKVKLPLDQARTGLTEGGTAVNNALKNMSGFSVNHFKVTEAGFDFDGTIPAVMKSAGSFR